MKAVGIVAEYNPLHNGHVYNIEEAKRLSGADFVIVALSGNFVQRGEPAVLDKWTRAKLAIHCGADIVFEIPTIFCLSDASGYARAGVNIIKSSGIVSDIAFGSECGDYRLLAEQVCNLDNDRAAIDSKLRHYVRNEGLSYPAARARAYEAIYGEKLLAGPNDILAMEYIRNADWLNTVIIKRDGDCYNSNYISGHGYASATAIRNAMSEGKSVSDVVPKIVNNELIGIRNNINDLSLFNLIKYQIISMAADEIEACPSGGEGLAHRLKSVVPKANSLRELIELAKSKRYTYTRISRLLMQMILGISRDYFTSAEPEYLRLLAASKNGRRLISECEKNEINSIPLITNINRNRAAARESIDDEERRLNFDKQLELDRHASDIYNIIKARDLYKYSDNVIMPYIQ